MIIFNESVDLVVVESFNEATDTIEEETVMKIRAGEPIDADIVEVSEINGREYVTLQFGYGGGVAFGVPRLSFIEVP